MNWLKNMDQERKMLNMLKRIGDCHPLLVGQLLVFLVLNVLDGHSTWKVVTPDHYYREKNPLARWVLRKFGALRGIVLFKAVLLLILGGILTVYGKKETRSLNAMFGVANLLFLGVVINNYRVHKKINSKRSKPWEIS